MPVLNWFASFVIPAFVSAIVALAIGPLRVRLEEAAHRDSDVRREIRNRIGELILRLRLEAFRRQSGPGTEGAFTHVQLNQLLRPIARGLESPDLDGRIANRTKAILAGIVGEWRITYLSLVSDEYFSPKEEMALSSGQLGNLLEPRLFRLQFQHTQAYPQSATVAEVMLDPNLGKDSVFRRVAFSSSKITARYRRIAPSRKSQHRRISPRCRTDRGSGC